MSESQASTVDESVSVDGVVGYCGIYFNHIVPARVSGEDYEYLADMSWYPSAPVLPYAMTRVDGKNKSMHHIVFCRKVDRAIVNGMVIDHINGNRIDNRRENLREVTTSENIANGGLQYRNSTGFPGVSWRRVPHKPDKLWAIVKYNGRMVDLGLFDNVKDAAKVIVEWYKENIGYVPYRKALIYEMMQEVECTYYGSIPMEHIHKMRSTLRKLADVI